MSKDFEKMMSRIENIITDLMTKTRTPGLSIAIVKDGKLLYAKGFGARNLEENLPATPHTLYGIGSCTKSFTALAIMQLVQDGKISLDDPASKYIPLKIGLKDKPITIHHLLTHSTGIPSLGTAELLIPKMLGRDEKWIPLSSYNDFYRLINGAQNEIVDEPGKRFFYFNAGYTMLGHIIEKVTKMEFEDYIREKILKPLEMHRSTFTREEFEKEPDKMTPYWRDKGGKLIPVKHPFHKLIYAPGGLLSSVIELSNYLIANINKGKFEEVELVNSELIEEMQKIHVERPPGPFGRQGYGYGWGVVENFLGYKLVAHSGSTGMSSANLAFIPELKIGVAIASNVGDFPHFTVVQGILAALMGRDPEKEIPTFKIEKKLNMLSGSYETYKGIIRINIVNRGGLLYLERKDSFGEVTIPLIPEDEKLETFKFYILSGATKTPVEFIVKSPEKIDLYIERRVFHKVKS
ncbi:MAG: serine hydrolase [archaeon GB-1867-035]|nr:serine hydrolase [Candidatus Culexmicrobium profundum]